MCHHKLVEVWVTSSGNKVLRFTHNLSLISIGTPEGPVQTSDAQRVFKMELMFYSPFRLFVLLINIVYCVSCYGNLQNASTSRSVEADGQVRFQMQSLEIFLISNLF